MLTLIGDEDSSSEDLDAWKRLIRLRFGTRERSREMSNVLLSSAALRIYMKPRQRESGKTTAAKRERDFSILRPPWRKFVEAATWIYEAKLASEARPSYVPRNRLLFVLCARKEQSSVSCRTGISLSLASYSSSAYQSLVRPSFHFRLLPNVLRSFHQILRYREA